MAFSNPPVSFIAAAVIATALSSGCAVVETGASFVKATASVASATVGVASTVVGTTVVAGSAALSVASAAKSVTVATAGVAVAAGSLLVTGVQLAANARRADDVSTVTVVAAAPDRFAASDGRRWITSSCANVIAGQPALWVAMRSGETVVRTPAGHVCPVLAME